MRNEQPSFDDLATFQMVARHGSFAAAAKALAVPKSTVKRRIDRLEDALEVSLVVRSGRRASLTEAGGALAAHAETPLRALENISGALSKTEPTGTLRVTTPPDLASSDWFLSLLSRYRALYPQVRVDIDLGTRFVDLNEENVDVAIRPLTAATAPSLRMRRLRINAGGGLYASPAYLEKRGRPRRVEDLPSHDGIALGAFIDRLELFRGEERTTSLPRWSVVCTTLSFAASAAAAGLGISLLPDFVAKPFVDDGKLVRVLRPWSLRNETQLGVVWAAHRIESPRLRAFLDCIPTEFEV